MKQYLWIIGLALVIISAFGYALDAAAENSSYRIASTVLTVIGGVILAVSYFAYHSNKNSKS